MTLGLGRSIAGCFVLYLSGTLSSAAGVGGGALNVPILYNIFGFSYHQSVVLSLCTLLGNYISQFALNIDKRHPSKQSKPLIYWDAVLILLPSELGGSNLGVILSEIIPDTLLYVLAMIVLIIAAGLTLSKGINYYEKEMVKEEAIEDADSQPLLGESDAKLLKDAHSRPKGHRESFAFVLSSIIPEYMKCKCKHDPLIDNPLIPLNIPWVVISVVMGVWVFYAICYLIMNEFDTCSAVYYIFLGIIYALLLCEIIWGLYYLTQVQKADPDSVAEGDIMWGASAWYLPFLSFGIGILTSLLGIGGGELMGPLMLRLQILPMVSTGTTSIMSLLNTSSGVLHYLILGDVDWDFAPWVFVLGLAAGFSGRTTALLIANYYRRPSVMVFALFAVLVVCFCVYIAYIFSYEIDISIGSLCNR
jgi:uncharacterized membrane protein YfcA